MRYGNIPGADHEHIRPVQAGVAKVDGVRVPPGVEEITHSRIRGKEKSGDQQVS